MILLNPKLLIFKIYIWNNVLDILKNILRFNKRLTGVVSFHWLLEDRRIYIYFLRLWFETLHQRLGYYYYFIWVHFFYGTIISSWNLNFSLILIFIANKRFINVSLLKYPLRLWSVSLCLLFSEFRCRLIQYL